MTAYRCDRSKRLGLGFLAQSYPLLTGLNLNIGSVPALHGLLIKISSAFYFVLD